MVIFKLKDNIFIMRLKMVILKLKGHIFIMWLSI